MDNLAIAEKKLNLNKSAWKLTKLGELANDISSRVDNPGKSEYDRFVGLEHFISGDLKIKNWGSTENLGSSMKAFKTGDILFARRNAYLRRASLVEFNGCCSGDAFVIRENHDKIVPGFLTFILNSDALWDYANSNAAGTMSKRVKWRDLAEYEFLLPPKDQQTQLAELLWAMDEVIEKEIAVLEKNEILKESIHKDSVDYGYSSNSKKIPNSWRLLKIKEFATVQAGSTPLRATNDFFDDGNIPWVKTLDLNNGEIHFTEEKITELAIEKTSCKKRQKDTVLVAMYGGFNQIGRTGILKIEAATNQAVSAITVDKKIMNPEFLLIVLNAKVDYWKKVAVSSRKDPNITKVDIDNFIVPVPQLDVQGEIVNRLRIIINSIALIESKIASSKALQKSLINQIF